jgi:thiol-disulfide isomerase/thioredoxin
MTTPDASVRKSLTKVLAPILIIVVAVFGAVYAMKAKTPEKSQDFANPSAPTAPADVGTVLPDFQLTPIGDGKSAKLSDFHSKVTLVNFWATWCEACMEEMPSLVQLREAYKDKGFEVVGINLDQNASSVVPHALKQF